MCTCRVVLTNVTKVVKCCKVVYTTIGYVAEALEDASEVAFLAIDLVVFGQPVPANIKGRFRSWQNITNFITTLPVIGDE